MPGYPVVPLLSIAVLPLPDRRAAAPDTFVLFAVWLAVALVIYFTYSIHNSHLATAGRDRPGGDAMTYLVGYTADRGGREALALGRCWR